MTHQSKADIGQPIKLYFEEDMIVLSVEEQLL